uniref:RWD domain-containing protein n=1 Tax=Anopheles christyi TaxID=43041 RepID=A0A182K4S1_9DIPT
MNESDDQTIQNAIQKKALQKQLDEFQMLSAIYCNPGELQVDDYSCIDNLNSYINGETDRLNTKLDYRFELPLLPDQKVQILVELPHLYPALEMPRIVIRSAVIPREQERRLTDRIVQYIEEEVVERDEAYVYQVVCWIQDNFTALKASTGEKKEQIATSCQRATAGNVPIVFERLWIYSHHLKSKMKRQTIIKTARDLKLTGFSRPGKPAIICVEGHQADTQEFWRTIKPLKWQKIQIKFNETKETVDGSENEMADLRHFAAGFREELFCEMDEDSDTEDQPMSMSLFMKFLEKHNCGYIKKELGYCTQLLLPPSASTASNTGTSTGYKQLQKVAIGDQDGVLQVFSMKKDELQVHFKTLPNEKIASVKLGGQSGSVADKIFTASENKVRGFNKKGKLFLAFETSLTETIRSMCVSGSDLLVCGNHVYNHYRDCKEIGSYLCGDVIVDVAALCPNNTSRLITVLACSGRVLRILEHARVRQTLELESVPTVLYVPKGIGDRILCGFSDGSVILFHLNLLSTEVKREVLVADREGEGILSAITSLATYDLSGDGKEELIVGRRDGTLQVFAMNSDEYQFEMECTQIYHDNFNESISALQGGCVGATNYTEIVVCTYSGRIFGLTTQCISKSLGDNGTRGSEKQAGTPIDSSAKLQRIRAEIYELEQTIAKERERYQLSTQALSSGLSAIPMLPINDSFVLSKEDATFLLSLEIPTPIEHVLLQCDAPITLLDVEKNTAVVSFSECDKLSGNSLLASYRCQLNTNRIDLKFRTIEGQTGTLQVYITPNLQPKCCQLKRYPIKPLSLHMIVHNATDETLARPMNTLTLRGPYSQAEMHNWMINSIPELPEKLYESGNVVYTFRHVFIGTLLICEYGKGEATFRSDNITTISILKDFITKEATKKRIKLEISTSINESTIPSLIKLIEPKIVHYNKLTKDYQLTQALLDLDIRDDEEFNTLSEEYRSLIRNQQAIGAEFRKQPTILNRIYGILTDLYIDKFKFKGVNVKMKLPQLIELLENYSYDELVQFYSVVKAGDEELGDG